MTAMYEEQEAIELKCRNATVLRFNNETTAKIQSGEEAVTTYGHALMKRAIEPVTKELSAQIEKAKNGVAQNRTVSLKFLTQFKDLRVVAFLTARVIIGQISGVNTIQNAAIKIGSAIEDELRAISFDEQAPALFAKIIKETDGSGKRKRQVMVNAYNRYCRSWESISKSDKLHLGMKLIDIFQHQTDFVKTERRYVDKNKTEIFLAPTEKVCRFIENNKDVAALMSPIYLPMVVPPEDWTDPFSGGYITHHTKQLPFIKSANQNYLEELSGLNAQMVDVYDAINTIQRTPWQINPFVLDTFNEIHDAGYAIAGLPSRDDIPLPPSPLQKQQKSSNLTEELKVEFKKWKKAANRVYDENIRLKSKRLMVSKIGSIAQQFSKYEAIYFPHSCDFRGRAYPAPMYLNPQGNSLAKGLLMFADGKPLGDDTAVFHLAVHGANCFGYDKASLDERVAWVQKHTERILSIASEPLSDLWWAKEADDPWCFLAFCKEWEGYCTNEYDHVSFIPIAKDGSCSGLQHFSAVLRDPIGGAAVNLLPAEQPADIYQAVIDATKTKVHQDLKDPEKAVLARLWLDYGMTRKTAKRCTMTRVYGSTLFSARKFVQEYIVETDAKRRQENSNYNSPLFGLEFEASVYLAKHIWESINETVVAAKHGMDWLQSCARILAKENLPITWTTADGLPVMQNYPDIKSRRVKTRLGDQLIYLTLREEQNRKLDSRRQSNGISPNWVHSNDGCHLRMTVNLAHYHGVTHFAMIHDSFGCHASDIKLLNACLREAFLTLYVDADPLSSFLADVSVLTNQELPALPEKGSLDLEDVRYSEFFFA